MHSSLETGTIRPTPSFCRQLCTDVYEFFETHRSELVFFRLHVACTGFYRGILLTRPDQAESRECAEQRACFPLTWRFPHGVKRDPRICALGRRSRADQRYLRFTPSSSLISHFVNQRPTIQSQYPNIFPFRVNAQVPALLSKYHFRIRVTFNVSLVTLYKFTT